MDGDGDLLIRLGRSLCNIGHGHHSFRLGRCRCAICLVVVEILWWRAAEQYRAWRTDIQKKLMDQA